MGQRTQALVRFNNIDKNGKTTEVAAFSIHYQWGYGWNMLIDLLGLSRSRGSQIWELTRRRGKDAIKSQFTGSRRWAYDAPSPQNFVDTMLAASVDGTRNLSGMGIDNHQTMNDVIAYSDNDNGYAELTITAENHDMTATLKLFDSAGGHVTLAEYMRKSASLNETPKFVNAYKDMLDCMGIELIEPAE